MSASLINSLKIKIAVFGNCSAYICLFSVTEILIRALFWHDIPTCLKTFNVYQFSNQIKLYLFSEQLEISSFKLTLNI